MSHEPDSNCICGHVYDEHNPRTGTCQIEGCLCGGFDLDERAPDDDD
jgi:hypothetical protein